MLLILEKFYFQDVFDKSAAYYHALLEVYESFFDIGKKKDCSLSINEFLFHVEGQLLYNTTGKFLTWIGKKTAN